MVALLSALAGAALVVAGYLLTRRPWGTEASVVPVLGSDQVDFVKARASDTLLKHIREPVAGASLRLSANDMCKLAGSSWPQFLLRCLRRGVRVVAYSGPKVDPQVKGVLDELVKAGLVVRMVPRPASEHVIAVSDPPQIWREGVHDRGAVAYGCSYTAQPYPEALAAVEAYFEDLEARAVP